MNAQSLFKPLAAAALLTLAAAPGLAAQQRTQEPQEAGNAVKEGETVVRVENHNWLDMHIYVLRDDGMPQSLGVVASNQTAELTMPAGTLDTGASVRLIADPIGGNGIYVSPDIFGGRGDEVLLTIENALSLSFTSLRSRAT